MKEFNKDEYNKTCAILLGWKEDFAHEADKYGYIQTIDGYMTPFINVDIIHSNISEYNRSENVHSIAQLKFDSDWNWIMEVYNKINHKDTAIFLPMNGVVDSVTPFINELGKVKRKLMDGEKEGVVHAIWEFLNWYKKKEKI